jgi:cysteine synthase
VVRTLFGGPSQPLESDKRGGIFKAAQYGKQPGTYNPNQYISPHNPDAHARWTAPELLRQLPKMNVFCAGMGTSGLSRMFRAPLFLLIRGVTRYHDGNG